MKFKFLSFLLLFLSFSFISYFYFYDFYAFPQLDDDLNTVYNGVNMHGFYTRTSEARDQTYDLPPNYFEESFKILSTSGLNHVRFLLFWESYAKNPVEFIDELKTVANAADKWNINVLYDNHQFHTSSYLNPQRGTGFPFSLFESDFSFFYGSGGGTKYPTAKTWWTNWWDRNVNNNNGNDGWDEQASFLQKVISTVDNHTSTLGYEILSEPQVHDKTQWDKIGKYNTFMTDYLRQYTSKIIAYSMSIPVSLQSDIELNPENLSKMAPANTTNIIFKISVYGLPQTSKYQESRLDTFIDAAKLANVPLYIGEWNNVKRDKIVDEEGEIITLLNETFSSINQTEADLLVQTFKDLNAWGSAFWQWRVDAHRVPNFNLLNVTNENIETTNYFDIVVKAYNEVYKESELIIK